MVILAITPNGLRQALQLPNENIAIWCGSDAISEPEYLTLPHHAVSRFAYPLAHEGAETLVDAVDTIAEHHPNQTIFVEHIPQT